MPVIGSSNTFSITFPNLRLKKGSFNIFDKFIVKIQKHYIIKLSKLLTFNIHVRSKYTLKSGTAVT